MDTKIHNKTTRGRQIRKYFNSQMNKPPLADITTKHFLNPNCLQRYNTSIRRICSNMPVHAIDARSCYKVFRWAVSAKTLGGFALFTGKEYLYESYRLQIKVIKTR